jgi:hypothetical protein
MGAGCGCCDAFDVQGQLLFFAPPLKRSARVYALIEEIRKTSAPHLLLDNTLLESIACWHEIVGLVQGILLE